MSKFYVYRGFNQYDGLCGNAESKEEAQKIIQSGMKDNVVCELSDIYEFDCRKAYEDSSLHTEIYGLIVELEEISYGYNEHYCIDLDEIATVFDDNEIKNYSSNELFAHYLQRRGFGNVEQAVRAFAEELKKVYSNCKNFLLDDEFCDLLDKLLKKRFGEG